MFCHLFYLMTAILCIIYIGSYSMFIPFLLALRLEENIPTKQSQRAKNIPGNIMSTNYNLKLLISFNYFRPQTSECKKYHTDYTQQVPTWIFANGFNFLTSSIIIVVRIFLPASKTIQFSAKKFNNSQCCRDYQRLLKYTQYLLTSASVLKTFASVQSRYKEGPRGSRF